MRVYPSKDQPQETVLAVGFGCWGKGQDLQTAVNNCLIASGSRKAQRILLYHFIGGTNRQHKDISMDERGNVTWPGEDEQGNEVIAYKLGYAMMKGVTR